LARPRELFGAGAAGGTEIASALIVDKEGAERVSHRATIRRVAQEPGALQLFRNSSAGRSDDGEATRHCLEDDERARIVPDGWDAHDVRLLVQGGHRFSWCEGGELNLLPER